MEHRFLLFTLAAENCILGGIISIVNGKHAPTEGLWLAPKHVFVSQLCLMIFIFRINF